MITSKTIKQLYLIVLLITAIGCKSDSDIEEKEVFETISVNTFNKSHLGFSNDLKQNVEQTFNFPENNENIEEITMYVKLECPSVGCGAWDVFANIKVKDPKTEIWYELGRYITPYGIDNSQRPLGFVFDVTDFKSILKGSVQLKSFIEVWTKEGWLLSVDFKIQEGKPKYKYSAVVPLLDYTNNSQQIPYGEELPTGIKLKGDVVIPDNATNTKLRTVVSGWGHATPNDNGGRGCAEWCFRTHTLTIGGNDLKYSLDPIGCTSNPVSPQNGNWQGDRAGWCPGQEVPIRTNELPTALSGQTVNFDYGFEDWTNDDGNGKAYYSISTYLVVESDTPIEKPVVN